MILICDSGSTKADFALLNGNKIESEFQTDGLNPVHLAKEIIVQKLFDEIVITSNAAQISDLYFYGSGCGNAEGKSRMEAALKVVFPQVKLFVDNDLLAAAKASCGDEKGIISILGTGSNCCYYDGEEVIMKNFGLGYILGDEASGTWYGKYFLRAFLYNQLPEDLHRIFYNEFKLDREQVIDSVYRKPGPNIFLSSFMPFISKYKGHDYINNFLRKGLNEFFESNISGFPEAKNTTLHFVGSIAALLEKEINETGNEKKYKIGSILKKPMDGLKKYFLKKYSSPFL